ncbi:YggS family pyridoxal phosphate-dependent enzyme [Pigmentibacter sp. JX0631]|uniref:YggS family pyridoxal phosphate-dependent enzyme n=1 Tax=Pigmentibacter sp. JX0631 TaxID=2976982 RepID=UPI002468E900|nr:YggS family pyridoxal phosphate-dependent enzyme [Pigmentibacter sp. JX0631]WGL59997.1 YggS family pyridoxal phosphate-dependent enzyme [Pigmentibacter sp. JX0631]
MNNFIESNLNNFKTNLTNIATKYKRNIDEITIIAVSKYQDCNKINSAYSSGQINFGENYIQEWQEKVKFFQNSLPNLKWHLIGNLQKNKAKYLTDKVFCLQSLDSIDLAKEIEKKGKFEQKLKVLIQLQIDKNDQNKSGITIEQAKLLRDYIWKSSKISFAGFMGIGPLDIEINKRKELYYSFIDNAYNLWKETNSINTQPILSLGMSSDYETAIECGSNMLRIGTAIFGERNKN